MALTLLQGVMWPEPRTRSSVSMKIRGSVHKTPSPGPGTQWMNTLPSLFSTGYHYFRSLVMKNATVQILCAPLSMGFSRHEYCSGLPCPPPGDLPDPEIEAPSLTSPALTGLQRITSTVTCRPHLAPRLSAAREGVSSSPLPSESWCWILSLWTVFAAVSVGRGNRYACPVQKACDDLNHRKQLYLPGTWLDGQPVSPPALIDP
ncbi:uncharacterized protein LOC129645921 isoform X9 [Bubalus kerabau]|uniref:uncharacterized protein LOC129645921 isoform X9 n=1 Tax=Bubalus carabanensis TaxID=3119969 RepID=UPI00244EBBB3|nr:uncharacterized protein LOC129645921 isoform X9 [Bubalus carabanensis]